MATTCNVTTTARPLPLGLSSLVSVIAAALQSVVRALKNRRDARLLAGMDDRMLADIGLTRSDLHDAYAEPLWRDPTDLLAGRACEKRRYRRGSLLTPRIAAPSLAPDVTLEKQRARRTTRHSV
ncbi:DUF1127 domain-containing protein [Pseudorhodoplanes sinuspersici]|uniref:YjiS-like domain-containing protein n=1 Tax=Pseudorhodoplanes sinuspersici TaxID=1235591 RepID=A0A1W6ZMF1_9HYPH|nr:DUF1127 domain-containing protein [Pseudorhodoplanes sinuspersici]ARP98578.1 hypothetical protein CAK95_05395 [Pseudorhodoplanes sinuspersici]RKE69845.1 uncharacterized protein YjiS (DUF1127 family) [Pseudorhodoplanes sinuspersici]